MIVRINLGQGRAVRNATGKNRHVALACAALLAPVSLMAYVLGVWRLTSDIGLTREFAIRGVLSHWQIWIAAGVALHVGASVLNRYGRGGDLHLPGALSFRIGRFQFGRPRPGDLARERDPPLPSSKSKSAQAS